MIDVARSCGLIALVPFKGQCLSRATLASRHSTPRRPSVRQWLVANVLGIETFIFGRFLLYVPTTPPYKTPSQPMRAPRMWGVERDPRASLGRRGAHGDGLVGVFQGGVRGRGGVAARHRGHRG